jgi:hypothetical protein
MNSQGTGPGAILDSSYHLVDSSNPATAGTTTILIYCTGLGAVSANQPATGAARFLPMPTQAGSDLHAADGDHRRSAGRRVVLRPGAGLCGPIPGQRPGAGRRGRG